MKPGTILFAGTDLSLYGATRFTIRKSPDPAPPAKATHWRTEIGVDLDITAHADSTAFARLRALQSLLASTTEALLEIRDENSTALSWLATPGPNGLADAIRLGSAQVRLDFLATEPIAAAAYPLSLTIDPLDGSPPILLSRPLSWSENIRIDRPSDYFAHRSRVTSSLAFAARTLYADATTSAAARAESLLAEADRLRALSGRECLLSFGSFSRTVQFESLNPEPSEGWDFLTLQAQCRYSTIPGDTEAEVSFTSEESTEHSTGESRITVSGEIIAQNRTVAMAKADAILAAWRTTGRRLVSSLRSDQWADGYDSEDDSATWTGLRFSYVFAAGSTASRYTLSVATRDDPSGRRVTYSGRIHSSDIGTISSTIAAIAAGKHPILLSAETTVESATDDLGAAFTVSASFTYEYLTAAASILGTVEKSDSRPAFGDWTGSASGSFSAPDANAAIAAARAHIPAGAVLLTDDEKLSSAQTGAATQLASLSFQYTWRIPRTTTAIEYSDSESVDYSRMTADRTVAGSCRAPDLATAQAALAAFLAALGLANPSRKTTSSRHEQHTSGATTSSAWIVLEFSFAFDRPITGEIGHDIIEATWSVVRIGQVDHAPITEVPLAKPVRQSPFGYNIGRLSATGSIRARQQSTALAWGQAKRAAVAYTGNPPIAGAEDPPEERMAISHIPFNGTTAAFCEFAFTYSFRYHDGLTGLWSSDFTL